MQENGVSACLEITGELGELGGSGAIPGLTDQVGQLEIVVFVARHAKKSKINFGVFLGDFLPSSLVLGRSTLESRDRLGTKEDGFRQLSEVPVVRKSKVCSGPPDTPNDEQQAPDTVQQEQNRRRGQEDPQVSPTVP